MLFLIIAMISYILMVLSFVFRYKDEKLHAMAFISFVFFLFSIIISFSEDNEEEHFIEVFNENKQYIESNISENKIENASLTNKKIELNNKLYDLQYYSKHFRIFQFKADEILELEEIK